MSDPLSLSTRPGSVSGVRGKHIGKLPIIIAITLAVLLIGGIIFGAANRMNRNDEANIQTPTDSKSNNEAVEPSQAFVISDDDEKIFNEQDDDNVNATITPTVGSQGVRPTTIDESIAELRRRQKLEELQARVAGQLSASKISFNGTKEVAEGTPTIPSNINNTRPSATTNNDPSLRREELLSVLGRRNGGADDQNGQNEKIRFVGKERLPEGYLPNTVVSPLSKYEIKTGTVIPALLLTDLNSDLPGMALGQVRTNVYDSATGQYLLIPQGARLIGEYDSKVSYGQNRALVVWRRVVFPNGASVNLSNMAGIDQSGASGFKDKVNQHYGRIFGSIFGLSIFQAIPSIIQSDSKAVSSGSELEKITAANISKTGEKLTEKNLALQPTIRIRSGYRFNILVNKDILFPGAYRG